MNENKNIDQMLEDFLADNHVEDRDFSQNVMTSLPQGPRLVWLTHLYPVLGILVGLFAIWKFDVVNPKTVMLWASKLLVLWNTHIGFSATISLATIVGVVAVLGFFVSEKIKDF